MQHNPSWEADSSPASQEIHRILRKPKFHYRVLQIPPLGPHLSQNSPRPNPICLRTTLILSSHLRIDLRSCLFPPMIPNKTVYEFLHSSSPPCLSQNHPFPSSWSDHQNNIWWCSSLYNLITRIISGDALHCTIFSGLLLFHSFNAKYLPQHRFSDILRIRYPVTCETVFQTHTKQNAEL